MWFKSIEFFSRRKNYFGSNSYKCVIRFVLALITLSRFSTNSYKLNIGSCSIYFEEPCNPEDIQFYLSKPAYDGYGTELLDPFSIGHVSLNKSIQTKIIIHGYGGLGYDKATKNITRMYRQLGYNVIVVDWSNLATIPCYPAAYFNTWHVGQCLAIMAISLTALGITPDMLHVLGFSLGAHIASFASNHLQKTLGTSFDRITGLDPALPFFATFDNQWKLEASDANFVDVIHTSAGSFGKLEALGHVDFYINGGSLQPFCLNKTYPPLCSHMMAGIYYALSLSNQYVGYQCDNVFLYTWGLCDRFVTKQAILGEYCDRRSRGSYFVDIDYKGDDLKTSL